MSLPPQSRLSRYLTIILRWWAIALVIFMITLWAGRYVTGHLLPKVYFATTRLQYQLPAKSNADLLIRIEVGKILAPDTLLPVIYDLELEKTWASRLSTSGEEVASGDDAEAYLARLLKVETAPGSNVITITARSDNPKEAADIANAIATRYKAAHAGSVAGSGTANAPNPVQILAEATAPTEPTHPNPTLCLYVTFGAAVVMGVLIACFVEVVFLFIRASKEEGT
jgi:uncharacterized protein involved in exopolysaccharide biosynthesis